MKIIHQNGQTAIESLLTIIFIIPCLVLGIKYAFIYGTKILIQSDLYESMICLAKDHNEQFCKKSLQKKINAKFNFGKIQNIQFKKNKFYIEGKLIWKVDNKIKISISKTIKRNLI